jgi:predicted DsbA family dithiol-disulfide isomerase
MQSILFSNGVISYYQFSCQVMNHYRAMGSGICGELLTDNEESIYWNSLLTLSAARKQEMKVEIWSDLICPWCYIGKRRFEMALIQFENRESVEVIWRSFELDPHSPSQHSVKLAELLARKYATAPQQAAAMIARVTDVAREMGLEYHLNLAHPGNTFDAHRLLHFATLRQLGEKAAERIMRGYFCEGQVIGDRKVLARLAPEFGMPEEEALTMLESNAFSEEVRADEARARELSISGVPFFLIDGKTGISGAQPVEIFVEALQKMWANK